MGSGEPPKPSYEDTIFVQGGYDGQTVLRAQLEVLLPGPRGYMYQACSLSLPHLTPEDDRVGLGCAEPLR